MPVDLKTYSDSAREAIYEQAYIDQKRQQRTQNILDAVNGVAKIGQAYQDYSARKREGELYNTLVSQNQNSFTGPNNNLPIKKIDVLQDPGGGPPQVLSQEERMRMNALNQANPASMAPSTLQTARSQVVQQPSFNPLLLSRPQDYAKSTLAQKIADARIKQMFPDPMKKYVPTSYDEALMFERAKAGLRGTDPNSPLGVEKRQAKIQDQLILSELKKMQDALPKLDQADQALGQLQSLYYEGVKPTSGPEARVAGPFKRGASMIGFNPALNRYLANRKAFAGVVSKGGFGEAGMLTDQDIARVTNALPNESSTKEEAEKAFQEVGTLLKAARSRYYQRRGELLGEQSSGRSSVAKQLSDPNVAAQFLKEANGDKEAARELARRAGYEF